MTGPSAHYGASSSTGYPDAKVALTAHSRTPSCAAIEKGTDLVSLGIALVRDQVFGGLARRPRVRHWLVRGQRVGALTATVPAGRLLVHELGNGWEPLRKHLP